MERIKQTILHSISNEKDKKTINNVFDIYKRKEDGVVVEIEDNNGNSIGAIKLNGYLFNTSTKEQGELSCADFDGDYVFDTDSILVRVQLDDKIRNRKTLTEVQWGQLINEENKNNISRLFAQEKDLIVVEEMEDSPYSMDEEEILHMLVNNNICAYQLLADNCIEITFNDDDKLYLICPLCSNKATYTLFKRIKNLLG